jgi:hypothetical protein
MSALRILQRSATARGIGLSYSPLRLVCNDSLGLYVRSKGHSPQAVARQSFNNTIVRCISQANKDKVIERKDAIKASRTVEDRVKKIVSEQLGVRPEEVRRCYFAYFP